MHCTNEQHQTFGYLSGPVIYEPWVSKLLPDLEPQVLLGDFVPLFVLWVLRLLYKTPVFTQGHPTTECFQIRQDGFLYALEACLVNLELP